MTELESLGSGPILVGFKPDLHPAIIGAAVGLARAFDCEAIFVYVELNSALVELEPTTQRYADSLAPDVDEEMGAVALGLRDTLAAAVHGAGVNWSLRVLAGDPASALSRLGAELGARMFVVGTRRPGPLHHLEEILGGSVGKALAMGQTRPVVLVPMGQNSSGHELLPEE